MFVLTAAAAQGGSTSPFPTWYIIVSILGLIVAAGGMTAIAWAVKSIISATRTVHEMRPLIPGLKTIVEAFVGSPGVDGSRPVVPLLTQLDQTTEQGLQNQQAIGDMQTTLLEVQRQVSPNGGNTNSFADQFVSFRDGVKTDIKTLVENQAKIQGQVADLASRVEEARSNLSAQANSLQSDAHDERVVAHDEREEIASR